MSSIAIEQLRASDFVILTGVAKATGKAFKFAKVDSRCSLMNNPVFLMALEKDGSKVVAIQ